MVFRCSPTLLWVRCSPGTSQAVCSVMFSFMQNFRDLGKSKCTSKKERTLNKLHGEPGVSSSWMHLFFFLILLRFGGCKNVRFRHHKTQYTCGQDSKWLQSLYWMDFFLLIRRNIFLCRKIMSNIQAWDSYWRLVKSHYFDHCVLGDNLENHYRVPAPGNCSAG